MTHYTRRVAGRRSPLGLALLASLGCLCEAPEQPPVAPPASPPIVPTAPIADGDGARPSWAQRFEERPAGPRQRSSVAQLDDAPAVFASLEPLTADPFEGLLVCRVDVTRRQWDERGLFGRHVEADVTLHLRLGERTERVRGPEDTQSFHASVPGCTLSAGDTLGFRAVDRDLGFDESMESLELDFEGELPVSRVGRELVIDCRGASAEWAVARAAPGLEEVDAALTRLEAELRPEPTATRWTFPDHRVDEARRPLHAAAALLGWRDGHIAARVERAAALEVRWRRDVTELLERRARELPAPGAPLSLGRAYPEVRVAEATCEAAGDGAEADDATCRVVLEARHAPTVGAATAPQIELSLMSAEGREQALAEVRVEIGGRVASRPLPATAATHRLTFAAAGAGSLPALAVAAAPPGGRVLLRLR